MTATTEGPASTQRGVDTEAAPRAARRPWLVLGVLALAQLMLVLDVTVVNVALPSIGTALRLDQASVPWVMTSYTVAFGGLMLLGGRVADHLGPRRVAMAGLVVFTAASAGGGLAHGAAFLLVSRALQGAAAAFLSPAALALVTGAFDGARRTRALGVWAAIGGVGAALGVVLGGVVTSTVGWRWIFYLNLPLGALVLIAVPLLVPGGRPDSAVRPRLDITGAVLATGGTASLIYGLVHAGGHGWTDLVTLGFIAAALALWAALVAVESRAQVPLLDPRLFRQPAVASSAALLAMMTALLIGGSFLASFLLQRGHGYSAVHVGVDFLPLAAATIIGAQGASHLIAHVGARRLAVTGAALAAIGLAGAAHWTDPVPLIACFTLACIGIGAGFVTAFAAALDGVEPAEAGMRSAIVNTFHELGGAFGVAVLSSVANVGLRSLHVHDFGRAYFVAALAAAVTAVAMALTMPAVRTAPATGLHGH